MIGVGDFLSATERFIGPIYKIFFVFSIIFGIATGIFYYLTFLVDWIRKNLDSINGATAPVVHDRVLISVVAGLIVGVLFIFARISVVQRARIQITEEIRRCVLEHLNYRDEMRRLIEAGNVDNTGLAHLISVLSRNHSVFLCSRLAEIFELLTYCGCHASIKTFNKSDGQVKTRTRDALSHNVNRNRADEQGISFNYVEHTAFKEIIDNPKRDSYINNWLTFSEFVNKYKNPNKTWKNYYRSTAVAPITANLNSEHINADTVIGFVCIDNKSGNFNKKNSRAILGVFVVLVNDMMVTLGKIQPSD